MHAESQLSDLSKLAVLHSMTAQGFVQNYFCLPRQSGSRLAPGNALLHTVPVCACTAAVHSPSVSVATAPDKGTAVRVDDTIPSPSPEHLREAAAADLANCTVLYTTCIKEEASSCLGTDRGPPTQAAPAGPTPQHWATYWVGPFLPLNNYVQLFSLQLPRLRPTQDTKPPTL